MGQNAQEWDKTRDKTCNGPMGQIMGQKSLPTVARAHTPPSGDTSVCPTEERDGTHPGQVGQMAGQSGGTGHYGPEGRSASRPPAAPSNWGRRRTDFQTEIIAIAQRILHERDTGRSVDSLRLQWAEAILRGNAPSGDVVKLEAGRMFRVVEGRSVTLECGCGCSYPLRVSRGVGDAVSVLCAWTPVAGARAESAP